jgi:hypothetical protein
MAAVSASMAASSVLKEPTNDATPSSSSYCVTKQCATAQAFTLHFPSNLVKAVRTLILDSALN